MCTCLNRWPKDQAGVLFFFFYSVTWKFDLWKKGSRFLLLSGSSGITEGWGYLCVAVENKRLLMQNAGLLAKTKHSIVVLPTHPLLCF